jgi:hypothetical protein
MLRLLAILTLLLVPLQAGAQAHLPPAGPPHRPGGGPPPPDGPGTLPLSFEVSRSFAARAAMLTGQLQPGALSLKKTPQGPRLSLALTYLGRTVTSVILQSDLSFAERPNVPLLPDVKVLPALSSAQRGGLAKEVATLAASGLAQATGPQVRVALLLGGAPVSELRFDRASGMLLAEPPDRGRGAGTREPRK